MNILSRMQCKRQSPVEIPQALPANAPLSAKDWLDLQWLAKDYLTAARPLAEVVPGLLAWRICPASEQERAVALRLAARGVLTAEQQVWRLTERGLRQIVAVIQHRRLVQ
jgi:hypothetical protein